MCGLKWYRKMNIGMSAGLEIKFWRTSTRCKVNSRVDIIKCKMGKYTEVFHWTLTQDVKILWKTDYMKCVLRECMCTGENI